MISFLPVSNQGLAENTKQANLGVTSTLQLLILKNALLLIPVICGKCFLIWQKYFKFTNKLNLPFVQPACFPVISLPRRPLVTMQLFNFEIDSVNLL